MCPIVIMILVLIVLLILYTCINKYNYFTPSWIPDHYELS